MSKPLFRRLLELAAGYEDIFDPETAKRLEEDPEAVALASALRARPSSDAVLAAMRAISAQRSDSRAQDLDFELVATTPGFTSSVARETESAVLGLIDGARRQIIAVGYLISSDAIVVRLHRAAERGVEVVIISDRTSAHGEEVIRAWPAHLELPRVYQERPSSINSMAKMHGKALLVDGDQLFISSANFTWLAMRANIELGVVLSGPRIRPALVLFEELFIDSGLLERVRM